ncbi:Non-histone chromosomal protein 6 [Coemansia sp. RSA 2049]|nr:Non-histone chromosomal protein 6 [Coemansia sp. RSA 2049]KAJ2615455.1 Non-histone chromosomal protein 6 [Coemansia sp. RSA 1804]KAJ2681032.1 Non-histone chromosomal protein 6 [Coemansia sp. RSA 1285]
MPPRPTAASRKKAEAAAPPAKVKKGASKASGRVEKVTKRGKRTKKNPNAPKRALSAYMFFSQANRATVREQNPTVSFGYIGKILGEQWKGLSEADKQPYVKMSDADKLRYEAEKAAFEENGGNSSS